MLDFLSSPVLFPSDMDNTPKLTANATFKLPEPMNWADYDYYNTMMDRSMTSLTDLNKLEPINENNTHVYAPFLLDDAKLSQHTYLDKTATGGFDVDSKRMALLGLAQSMVQAYSFPFYSAPVNTDDIGSGGIEHVGTIEQQKLLRANLRGALDVVEHDMQKNGHDSLYAPKEQQYGTSNAFSSADGQWSWREEIVDVPDLVHSVCSSSSTHSLADDHHPSTPVLLESGISSFVENDGPDQHQQQQQQVHEQLIGATLTSPSLSIASPRISSPQQSQRHGHKIKLQPIKKWVNKMKQATSTVKQDCAKSLSNTSRKLCQWIMN